MCLDIAGLRDGRPEPLSQPSTRHGRPVRTLTLGAMRGVPAEGVGQDDRFGRSGRPSPANGRLVEEAVRLLRIRISAHARIAPRSSLRRSCKTAADRQPRRVLARTHPKSRGRRIHARTDADGAEAENGTRNGRSDAGAGCNSFHCAGRCAFGFERPASANARPPPPRSRRLTRWSAGWT